MERIWRLTLLSLLCLGTAATVDTTTSASTYDYIVVGSGPGGGTLAANLAKAGESVLLLEAGADEGDNLNEEIPGWFFLAYQDPTMRWDFFVKYHSDEAITAQFDHLVWKTTDGQFYVGTTPPAGAEQLGVYYPRAGTLGGCSTHNALCAALPSNSDWDYVADITSDDSWTATNMRQYFIKLENDHVVPVGTPGHGFDGFLDITINGPQYAENQSQAVEVLEATAQVLGQDPSKLIEILTTSDLNNDDPDRDQQVGLFGFPAHRNLAGRRVSARNAVVNVWNATYANGSQIYPLTVSLNSFVTKVLFDTTKTVPRATGVQYLVGQSMYGADPRYNASSQGVTKKAYARKEVIVSGGTFNSPQLLMLSGIGPKAQLESFDIPVIVDLPGVGSNLQDNTEFGVAATSTKENFTSLAPTCTYGAPGDPCLAAWYQGEGPYTQGPLDALMYKTSAAALNERDLFMFGNPGGLYQGYWPGETVNVVPSAPPSTMDFSMVKMHPQNRLGTLELTSNNPRDTPAINFRFFEGEGADADLQALAEGVALGRKIFDSMAANGSNLAPWDEILPCNATRACNVKDVINAQAWSHHATSSCSIGSDSDPLAVLDSSFRVRGTLGLRVVDASAFPRTPGGFPVIPTFMLGEKASDVILADTNNWC
ncbi:hypothetical protein G7Y89_g8062 [Cudoniella acicularis]|uniref:Glucose-methanol-choline oxidoreductase N-terminal domain-containing protein n=1 Tax=Cudoniella acicularis TaxID=354080 RepID=A0A8H4RJT5_9HELO|nr:hypothetical protein G7Y89_g8062 [Cudoniella acicularis]